MLQIKNIQINWKILSNTDKIADLSKYEEWEYLLQDQEIAAKTVYLHSQRTDYLNFSVTTDIYAKMLTKAGNIGYRIGGTSRSRDKIKNRVDQIIKAIK